MNFRRRLIITIGIDLGIILILGAGLWFLAKDIVSRANSIAQTRNEINSWTQAVQSLAALKQDSLRARTYLPELDIVFPDRDQLINFSRDLSELGRRYKVNVNSSLGSEERSEDKTSVRFNFGATMQGALENLADVLKELKNSRYSIGIKNLEIVREVRRPDGGFNMTINGQVFTYER